MNTTFFEYLCQTLGFVTIVFGLACIIVFTVAFLKAMYDNRNNTNYLLEQLLEEVKEVGRLIAKEEDSDETD